MTRELTPAEVESFRGELCDAATELFIEKGPNGVTLRALAERVGVSRTTPYRYFQNKDEILAAVQASAFQRFSDAAELAYRSTDDPIERIHAISRTYIEFGIEHPQAYRIMFGFFQEGDYPELRRQGTRARTVLFESTEAAVRAGAIAGDANVHAHVIWAALHGVLSLHLVGQLHWGPDVRDLAKTTVDAVLRGIAV